MVKEYKYINKDGTSSGVASYKPRLGGNEIPQHLHYTYNITSNTNVLNSWAKNLVPPPEYMSFYLIAESAFPSPAEFIFFNLLSLHFYLYCSNYLRILRSYEKSQPILNNFKVPNLTLNLIQN
ncbi:MAG: hypothetical protein COX07_07375 [Bacteroidetes bacterium CG23_combo_of_CG06-09_8_20_14_all_32_9]|nr:MAG: hypothetical protein COX07_07375 [Bacteroidetes bacterium CG23_combo_of_CG06-09_8_20_14_all_32_9]